MQRGRVAHFHVPHVLGSDVPDELVGDPLQRLRRLHHGQRDLVLREVFLETARPLHRQGLRQRVRRVRREPNSLGPGQLEHRLGTEASVQMDVQLRLGPAAQRLFRQAGRSAARRDHDAEDPPALAHRAAGIHRPPHAVRHVGGVAREQRGEIAVECRDRVLHGGATRHAHRPLVHEHAQLVHHHPPAPFLCNRASSGAAIGCRSTARYWMKASRSITPRSAAGLPTSIV